MYRLSLLTPAHTCLALPAPILAAIEHMPLAAFGRTPLLAIAAKPLTRDRLLAFTHFLQLCFGQHNR
jgi:hypothetical protein